MDKYFICLANSYKHGGRCVAGIEITFDANGKPFIAYHPDERPVWIRPVSDTPDEAIPTEIAQNIKLFSVVKLTEVVPCPHKAHVEDVRYAQMECRHGSFNPNDQLMHLCLDKKHQNIFYFQGKAVPSEMVDRLDYSLMLIKPDDAEAYIDEDREKSKYRMKFSYYGMHYDFSITDPVFLEAFKENPELGTDLKDAYLALSLGTEFEGFHFKLVAAVIQIKGATTVPEKVVSNDWFEEYETEMVRLINQKQAIEEQIAALRTKLIEQMELHHSEKVASKQLTVVYTPPRTVMQFDSKAFRTENETLYAQYCKPREKEASIVVRRNVQRASELRQVTIQDSERN